MGRVNGPLSMVEVKPEERILEIISLLEKAHRDAKIALKYGNALELLIATMLSAQCTDERVNQVTKNLFRKYQKPEDYANASLDELEEDIRPTGFYHNKAKNIKKACRMIVDKFGSEVPKTMAELVILPGVARKTANVVLSNAYGVIEGVAIDTHVGRVTRRLGLTQNKNPDKIEKDLMDVVPRERWARFTDLLIFHGRRICVARKPLCGRCVLNKICPSASTFDT